MTKARDLANFNSSTITDTVVLADGTTSGNTVAISGASFKNATSVRVGSLVNFSLWVVNLPVSGLTSGNTLYIRGLEYNLGTNAAMGSIIIVGVDLQTNARGLVLNGGGVGTNYCRISEQMDDTSEATTDSLTCGDLASNVDIFATLTYKAQ